MLCTNNLRFCLILCGCGSQVTSQVKHYIRKEKYLILWLCVAKTYQLSHYKLKLMLLNRSCLKYFLWYIIWKDGLAIFHFPRYETCELKLNPKLFFQSCKNILLWIMRLSTDLVCYVTVILFTRLDFWSVQDK